MRYPVLRRYPFVFRFFSVCSFDSFYNSDDFSCLSPELLMQLYLSHDFDIAQIVNSLVCKYTCLVVIENAVCLSRIRRCSPRAPSTSDLPFGAHSRAIGCSRRPDGLHYSLSDLSTRSAALTNSQVLASPCLPTISSLSALLFPSLNPRVRR